RPVHHGERNHQRADEDHAGPGVAHQNRSGKTSATTRYTTTSTDKISPTTFAALTASPPPSRSTPTLRRPRSSTARTPRHARRTPTQTRERQSLPARLTPARHPKSSAHRRRLPRQNAHPHGLVASPSRNPHDGSCECSIVIITSAARTFLTARESP